MPTILKPRKTKNNSSRYDAERRKIYNSRRWQHLRNIKFMNDPLCEVCAGKGLAIPAEDVHHIVSFMSTDDPQLRLWLAYDYSNLMSVWQKVSSEYPQRQFRKMKIWEM